jgi:cysteine-rich repeat protein
MRVNHDVRILAAVFMLVATSAPAHQDPPECFDTSAVVTTISLFRANGTTGVVGSVSPCETILYRVNVEKIATNTSCAFSDGALTFTRPNGTQQVIADPFPCIGGTLPPCDRPSFISERIPYTVDVADIIDGLLFAAATYTGGVTHDFTLDTPGVSSSGLKSTPVIGCDDNDFMTIDVCDQTGEGANACKYFPLFEPACGNGNLETGEECDEGGANGTLASCCTKDCEFMSATTVCRPGRSTCDADELCPGAAGACPPDLPAAEGTACRPVQDLCDAPEQCDGSDFECPADSILAAGTPCRLQETIAGVKDARCDVPESCTGTSRQCPGDGVVTAGLPCGNGDVCGSQGLCLDTCGNGNVDSGEACDDGNTTLGDGCRPNCTTENCGDGSLDPREQCDGDPGCSAECRRQCELDADCPGHTSCVRQRCDDGLCATNPSCNGDACSEPVTGLAPDAVTSAIVQCAFDRSLGGSACKTASEQKLAARANRRSDAIAKQLDGLRKQCGKPNAGTRLAARVRRLIGMTQELQRQLGTRGLSQRCQEELNLIPAGLADRVALLESLASNVAKDPTTFCSAE